MVDQNQQLFLVYQIHKSRISFFYISKFDFRMSLELDHLSVLNFQPNRISYLIEMIIDHHVLFLLRQLFLFPLIYPERLLDLKEAAC